MRVFTICTLAALLACTPAIGQSATAFNWYFGHGYALSFADGSPKKIDGGPTQMEEGGAVYSDPCSGELRFYTDGYAIWDRQHQLMPGSAKVPGLTYSATGSTTQSALIIPHPGNPDLFYVLNPGNHSNPVEDSWPQFNRDAYMHFSYQLVSLSARGGLGDVIDQNVLRPDLQLSEKICAIHDKGKNEYIIATTTEFTGEFCMWRIGPDGLREEPSVVKPDRAPNFSRIGQLKFSPDGSKLAEVEWYPHPHLLRIYEFDMESGTPGNAVLLPILPDCGAVAGLQYGLSFSPDSRLLYTTGAGCGLQQFRVDVHDSAAIAQSLYLVDYDDKGFLYFRGGLQMGPDRKIYVFGKSHVISVIENPNAYGDEVVFRRDAIEFEPAGFALGLPNFIDQIFDLEYQGDNAVYIEAEPEVACVGQPVQLQAYGGDSYVWEPAELLNDNTIPNPIAHLKETTCFTVKAQKGDCVGIAERLVKVHDFSPIFAVADSTICVGDSMQLGVEGVGPFEWEPSEGLTDPMAQNPTASPTRSTLYRVRARNDAGCEAEDSVWVRVRPIEERSVTLSIGDAHTETAGMVEFPLSIAADPADLPLELPTFRVTVSYLQTLLRIREVPGATVVNTSHADGRTFLTLEIAARTLHDSLTRLGTLDFLALLAAQNSTVLRLEDLEMDRLEDRCSAIAASLNDGEYSNEAYCLNYELVLRQLLRVVLSPNPADTFFELDIRPASGSESVRIVCFDSMGKIVYNETAATSDSEATTVRIETGTWPSGVYAVRVQSGRSSMTINLSVVH